MVKEIVMILNKVVVHKPLVITQLLSNVNNAMLTKQLKNVNQNTQLKYVISNNQIVNVFKE